ncbi:MAG: nucleotidyltransferase family protein [Thermodesulfobacteriota bacterium]
MKPSINQIKDKLAKELPEINARYKIQSLGLFGSYIKNEQTEKSDLDILVTFNETPSLFKFLELENYLTDILNIKVDLVMKNSLKPNIGKRILDEVEML